MRQGLGLPYGLAPVNPSLGLEYAGPYTAPTLQEAIDLALQEFPKELRAQTVLVHLVVDEVGYLYWFKDGVENKDLVPWNPNDELYAIASASRSPLQTMYSKFRFDDLSDFDIVGTAPTIVNQRIVLTGTEGWNFDASSIRLKTGISNDQVDYEMIFQLKAKLGNAVVIGKKSASTASNGAWLGMSVFADFVSNTLGITDKGGETDYTSNTVKSQIFEEGLGEVGDLFRLIYSQRINVTTATLVNLTKMKYYQVSLSSAVRGPALDAFFIPNFSVLSISGLGTPIEILKISAINRQPVHPRIAVISDSKARYNADSCEVCWPSNLEDLGSIAVFAGASDTLKDAVKSIDYIASLDPEYAIISIGRNDVAFGYPAAQWQANYRTIRNTLAAKGIRIVHVQHIPDYERTPTNQTPIVTFTRSEWPGDVTIDISEDWVTGFTDPTDNLHPTPSGHLHIAERIVNESGIPKLPYKFAYERAPLPVLDYFEPYKEPVSGGSGPAFQPWYQLVEHDTGAAHLFAPQRDITTTSPHDYLLFLGKDLLYPYDDYTIEGGKFKLLKQNNIDASNSGEKLTVRALVPTQLVQAPDPNH